MSVGMASFEGRGEELDAVDVARRAGQLVWDARWRVWPYVLAVAALDGAARWLAWRYGLPIEDGGYAFDGHASLAEYARHGAFVGGRALAVGLAVGMTLRALGGYAHPAWRPDRGLLGFTAIYLGASLAPLAFFLPTILVWQGAGLGAMPLTVATALAGLGALAAFAWVCLRLVIWPVGVALDDPQMTAARAWNAMLGARIAWLFAGVLLVLPLILGSALAGAIVMGVTGLHAHMLYGPWEAPLHALMLTLWLAVGVAVYRLRSAAE